MKEVYVHQRFISFHSLMDCGLYVPYFTGQDHVSNWAVSLGNFDESFNL